MDAERMQKFGFGGVVNMLWRTRRIPNVLWIRLAPYRAGRTAFVLLLC